jgi:hypothetical protein
MSFESVVRTVGKDALHIVEFPFVRSQEFVKLLGDAMTQTPAVKAAVIELVKAGESIIGDSTADIATKGLDLVSDIKTVADVQAFFKIFAGTFLPVVESAYRELKADTTSAAA